MNKFYNTQEDIARGFRNILKEIFPNMRKTQLNILPYIIYGMSVAESSVASDIARVLKDNFSCVQIDSTIKRIKRFFNNKLFDAELLYDKIIKYVINKYKKKHQDNRVHIIIDHMFSKDNYTTLMFSMRVGNQGIPIWFRSFKGDKPSKAFTEDLILNGIKHVIDLFNDGDYKLIFLADRWFNSTSLMKYINDNNHIFCFRLKQNIKAFIYDKKEKHCVWKFLDKITNYQYHSACYNVLLSDNKFPCKLVYSKKDGTSDPWVIATNGNYKHTIKDYSYRFGGIETIFKNQKSNGFYIENTVNASERYYKNMYGVVCIAILFHTMLGIEYSKNSKCYRNVKITTHKNYKKRGKIRVMSIFQTGLTLFKLAINSLRYIRIPFSFTLYDM